MRPSVMEVDLKNFQYNIDKIKSLINENCDIMPVIKANAYGTYINTQIDLLHQFKIVAVAIVDEGKKLRELGYKNEIFVLNQPFSEEIDKIIESNLTVGISSMDFIDALSKKNQSVKVHLEIGTGMGRTGIHPNHVYQYIEYIKKYKNIIVEGLYTHMSSADVDDEYSKKQIESFNKALKVAQNKLDNLKYIHCAASNAIINYPEIHYNLVRPGMIMYGYSSGEGILDKIDTKPVCKLKSKVIFLKEVKEGTSIGYSRSFITNKKTKIATIPIGYADGIRRSLSNKGKVFVNGKNVPIIGKICMDSFMVDVTELENIEIGDDVWIWDNENIKLEDISDECDTINYEILCNISNRVPRQFLN